MSTPSTAPDPRSVYEERIRRDQWDLARLDRLGAGLANGRAGSFLLAVALALLAWLGRLPPYGYLFSLGALGVYAALALRHQRVLDSEDRAKLRILLSRRGLDRLGTGWHAFAETGERFLRPEHPNAPDLDLFGHGSLFQLINVTATKRGEARLAQWLTSPAAPEEIRARQEAVKELARATDFRQSLVVEARLTSEKKADPGVFISWAENAPSLGSVQWARPLAYALPLATAILFALGATDVIPGVFGWITLAFQLGVVVLTRQALAAYYAHLAAGETGFARFECVFAAIERQRFEAPLLAQLTGGETSGAFEPLRRFANRFSYAELRQQAQVHAVVNVLSLWDLHALFALEGWRREHGAKVRGWFDALAQLEALNCLAVLAHDRPDFAFPEIVQGEVQLTARALGHPLLQQPVRNDVHLAGPGSAYVVTGSNMSGKTTLLRAMGINCVLALAGGPVCAEALTLTPLQVLTSMRVKDSLERGVSYFYAEVQRLKLILDAAEAAKGCALFLLDEILLGTNTRERQLASREVIRLLLATGAIGAVSTHDLTLAALEDESGGRVNNVHFRDHLEGEEMTFDYRLREGVVQTTNALRVLRMAGVPIADRHR